jgi:hypothetical protein
MEILRVHKDCGVLTILTPRVASQMNYATMVL